MRTPSRFIRVAQLDPTGLSVQQRTAGGAPGENRGAQGRGSPSPASGTEAGGARGVVRLRRLPGPRQTPQRVSHVRRTLTDFSHAEAAAAAGVAPGGGPPAGSRGPDRQMDRKDTGPVGSAPSLRASVYLSYCLETPAPNTVMWGFGAPTCEFWGTCSGPQQGHRTRVASRSWEPRPADRQQGAGASSRSAETWVLSRAPGAGPACPLLDFKGSDNHAGP